MRYTNPRLLYFYLTLHMRKLTTTYFAISFICCEDAGGIKYRNFRPISRYLGNDTGELYLQWTSYRKSYSNGSIFTDLE